MKDTKTYKKIIELFGCYIADCSDEREFGDGCWIYLKDGYCWADTQCATLHEYNLTDLLAAARRGVYLEDAGAPGASFDMVTAGNIIEGARCIIDVTPEEAEALKDAPVKMADGSLYLGTHGGYMFAPYNRCETYAVNINVIEAAPEALAPEVADSTAEAETAQDAPKNSVVEDMKAAAVKNINELAEASRDGYLSNEQEHALSSYIKQYEEICAAAAVGDSDTIYMNTWANYNEFGASGCLTPACWMTLDDALQYCEDFAEFEPFTNDTSFDTLAGFIEFGDYSGADDIQELIDIRDAGFMPYELDVLGYFINDAGYDVADAIDKVRDGDFFYLDNVDNDADLGERYIDEVCCGVENLDRETIERYFDYEAFGRDLSFDGTYTDDGFIFNN